jgi:hypothetical protein
MENVRQLIIVVGLKKLRINTKETTATFDKDFLY